jgi:signal transduction histidine kinase/ligand-binding sensor domain-containing protein
MFQLRNHLHKTIAIVSFRLLPSLLLFFFLSTLVRGEYRFQTWNTENGLPQNSVNSIAQTPDGYIWLTTFDGLARFDGIRFKVFRKQDTPELPTNRLTTLFVDDDSRLWILTEDANRIVVYEKGQFKSFSKGKDFETDDMGEPWRLKIEMVLRNGPVEFFYENGAFRSRPATSRKLPGVFSDEHQSIWIDRGDHYLSGRLGSIESYPKRSEMPFDRLNLLVQNAVMIDGSLWFLLPYRAVTTVPEPEARLARLRDGEVTQFPVIAHDSTILRLDRNGNLWLGDFRFGAMRIDAKTLANADPANFPTIDAGLPDIKVRDMLTDRDGNLWICSEKGLRLLIEPPPIKVYTAADGLPAENIYSVIQDRRGTIWFGAWEKDLVRYEDDKFYTEKFDLVTALFEDRNSRLWVGNHRAWYRNGTEWKPAERDWHPAANLMNGEIDVISEDSAGNIWYGGADTGITRNDGTTVRKFTSADGLPGTSVTSFVQTRDGAIWVGTATGLARLDGDRFVSFTTNDGLGGNYIRSLYEDKEGILWIGTYDSGLIRYKNGEFRTIAKKDGLFSDGVFCILEDDDGWFWMNSNQGIYRARRQDLNDFADARVSTMTSAGYGPQDGLLNVEGNGGKQPAGLRSTDGRLWFPTAGGLAVVDPKQVHRDEQAPNVLIEEIKVDQNELPLSTDEVVLAPGQTALEINYTGIKFNNAERLRFRYRLEGLDDTWTEAGTRRTAYFSHLPFGDYTFRVLAANRDGVWSEQGAGIRVVIDRPYYRTYWFYALVTFFIAGFIGLVYFARVRQLRSVAEARELYARQLLESQERERSRLAMELHDSLGQSLVVIRNRALLGISKGKDDGAMLEQLHEISDASATALQETREIAHTLHPYQIEALGLTTALHSLIDKFANSSEIEFNVDIDPKPIDIPHDLAIAVYRIAQEWLTNVVKHSSADKVSVVLHLEGTKLTLGITDNGVGFDPQTVKKGLGLKGIEERARMIGAVLDIFSTSGAGAGIKLIVDLPETNG